MNYLLELLLATEKSEFTSREENFSTGGVIVDRAATASLVGSNDLPELSLTGEAEGQREQQERPDEKFLRNL